MRANDTTPLSRRRGRRARLRIGMTFVRRHLSWLLSAWLVCQVTALAAPVVLASGAGTSQELCTCPAGDHVVDIGAGSGMLSRALVDAGANVTAVEPDRRLGARLRRLPVTVVQQ